MNSNFRLQVGSLVLVAALAIPGNAAAELQSVLVRSDRDCWNDLRQRANPDSGLTLQLTSGEQLVGRSWFFYGPSMRRAIGVRLAAQSGDSLRVVPTEEIRSFAYGKRAATTPGLRLFGAVAGGVAGAMLATEAAGDSRSHSGGGSGAGSIASAVGNELVGGISQMLAGFAGFAMGSLIGYVIGDLVTPRRVQVEECACGKSPDSGGSDRPAPGIAPPVAAPDSTGE